MSIYSEYFSGYANSVKNEWVEKLEEALEPLGQFPKETAKLEEVIKEIKEFQFYE